MDNLEIFKGSHEPHNNLEQLPLPPPWRHSSSQERPTLPEKPLFDLQLEEKRGKPICLREEVKRAVNAALFLRRPLLVTGKPGVGKSSLAFAVAYELRMGPVLRWPITSRSTVKNGLYEYDAIGRLYAQQNRDPNATLGDFLVLGPVGTALYPTSWPRVLLIDEIDKGDLDLPNDLLNVLEEGSFEVPELSRAATTEETVKVRLHDISEKQPIVRGRVTCQQFPFIVMTSNGEREFPAPFLRRCIRLLMPEPSADELASIVNAHLAALKKNANESSEEAKKTHEEIRKLIADFVNRRSTQLLATDQLLNAAIMLLYRS